jgi:hypothetical protein
LIFFTLFTDCDKVTIEKTYPPLPVHNKDQKPLTPVQLGSIRGYFGDYYKTFKQHINEGQPIDSFSNCYIYGTCNYTQLNQIHLERCDSDFVFSIYIDGYSLDSLPATISLLSGYGKYADIQFYPFKSWNWNSTGHYFLAAYYGYKVSITDKSDDILTGTFEGKLESSTGEMLPVTEGEFKIKIFRKYMPCGK